MSGVSVSSSVERLVGGLGRVHRVAAAPRSRLLALQEVPVVVDEQDGGLGGHAVAPLSSISAACPPAWVLGSSTWKVVPRSGLGVEPDVAVVHLDDAVADGQAEAGALADALGGEEGLEDLVAGALRDAGALVADGEVDAAAALGPRAALTRTVPSRPSMASTPFLTRFTSTWVIWSRSRSARRPGVDVDHRSTTWPLGSQRRRAAESTAGCTTSRTSTRLDVHPALPREVEQVADDLLAALGLLGHELEVVVQVVAVLELLPEDVRVQQDRAQRVVELVRDAGRHLAHGGQLLGVDDVAVDVAHLAPGDVELGAHALRLVDHERQAHGVLGHARSARRRPWRGRWGSRRRRS